MSIYLHWTFVCLFYCDWACSVCVCVYCNEHIIFIYIGNMIIIISITIIIIKYVIQYCIRIYIHTFIFDRFLLAHSPWKKTQKTKTRTTQRICIYRRIWEKHEQVNAKKESIDVEKESKNVHLYTMYCISMQILPLKWKSNLNFQMWSFFFISSTFFAIADFILPVWSFSLLADTWSFVIVFYNRFQ